MLKIESLPPEIRANTFMGDYYGIKIIMKERKRRGGRVGGRGLDGG